MQRIGQIKIEPAKISSPFPYFLNALNILTLTRISGAVKLG